MMASTQCVIFQGSLLLRNTTTRLLKKEALALVLSVQHLEVYLGCAHPSTVYCYSNRLPFLISMRNFNQRLMRLRSYDVDIKHVRGKDNLVADSLSRLW